MNALYLYAYDGSGLGLRTEVEVVSYFRDRAVVRFLHYTPPVDSLTEFVRPDGTRDVRRDHLQPLESSTPIASFNWLD